MVGNQRLAKSNRYEYGNVDLSVIYDTVKNDIPELLEELKAITV